MRFETFTPSVSDEGTCELYEGEKRVRYESLFKIFPWYKGTEPKHFDFEADAIHVVAIDDNNKVVGCVLFSPQAEKSGRLFQMAVMDSLRGTGVGRKLVSRLESHLRGLDFEEITLHSRDYAIGFYEKLGYSIYGQPFEEVGVGHHHMRKSLL
eukprot:CFRG3858T1